MTAKSSFGIAGVRLVEENFLDDQTSFKLKCFRFRSEIHCIDCDVSIFSNLYESGRVVGNSFKFYS